MFLLAHTKFLLKNFIISIRASYKMKNEKKIMILNEIYANKKILFGAFSEKLTKQSKEEEWVKINDLAKSVGLIKDGKPKTYARDVLWQNMRRAAFVSKYWFYCL